MFPQLAIKDLRVYIRKKGPGKDIENSVPIQSSQESEPSSIPSEIHLGNSSSDLSPTNPMVDDLDLPIAHRKGVRNCTQHSILKFVSYQGLSKSYQAFVSTLDSVQVPGSMQEALEHPEWRKAVNEEVSALERNGTWIISELPQGKKPVGCKWIFTVKH